jgi:hypothetical protein
VFIFFFLSRTLFALRAEAFGEENLSPELLAQMEDISDESEDEIDNEIGEDLFA